MESVIPKVGIFKGSEYPKAEDKFDLVGLYHVEGVFESFVGYIADGYWFEETYDIKAGEVKIVCQGYNFPDFILDPNQKPLRHD